MGFGVGGGFRVWGLGLVGGLGFGVEGLRLRVSQWIWEFAKIGGLCVGAARTRIREFWDEGHPSGEMSAHLSFQARD